MNNVPQLALLSVLFVLAAEGLQAQPASPPHDIYPLRGLPWGQGGPWTDQEPYIPHPRPPGWVDPEPSRWPWTGSRDPYADARNAEWFGPRVQIIVLQGFLNQPVPFIARLKFPADAHIPAHYNAGIQRVTVTSGTLNIGLGRKLDIGKTHAFGPGSVTTMLPGLDHFFWFGEETIIYVCGVGPWVINHVDPGDDPSAIRRSSLSAPP